MVAWIVFALLLGLVYYVSIFEPNIDLPEVVTDDRPDFSFDDVVITHIEDGNLVWEIQSNYAEIDKKDKTIQLKRVAGIVFQDDKKQVSFNAPSALLGMDQSDMILEEPKAVVSLPNQDVNVRTQVLLWKAAEKMFYGSGGVEIFSDYMRVTGRRLTVDVVRQNIKITEQGFAEIYDNGYSL